MCWESIHMQQYCIPCEQWSVVHDNPHGNNTPSQPQWLVVHSLSIITAWQKRRRGTINFFNHHKDESSGLLLVLIPCLAFHHQFKLVEWEGVIYFHSINHLKIGNYRNKRKENQKMNLDFGNLSWLTCHFHQISSLQSSMSSGGDASEAKTRME